ncbi:MAG: hypothetical protein NTV94_14140, partial [Planctomycetota bacterium]|nr:hypothetical protein [Planctomycetota bacterium]
GVGVDQMIIEMARLMPAVIVTIDVALAQVARINSIAVLNLNDLANALKSALIPGEVVKVKLIRDGEQPGQAVGFLPDGTMVVAEDGSASIGDAVDLTVTSSLQTSAGRLIFARLGSSSAGQIQSLPVAMPDAMLTSHPQPTQSTASQPASTSPPAGSESDTRPQGPFPPAKTFRPTRPGTPRNPRR